MSMEATIVAAILKVLTDSVLAMFLLGAAYLLRPVLQRYLDQQIEQLKLIAAAMKDFGDRLDRVERKVGEIAEDIEIHAR